MRLRAQREKAVAEIAALYTRFQKVLAPIVDDAGSTLSSTARR
jgi:hypothetical protein